MSDSSTNKISRNALLHSELKKGSDSYHISYGINTTICEENSRQMVYWDASIVDCTGECIHTFTVIVPKNYPSQPPEFRYESIGDTNMGR